jgi:AcrR family transcriptional regulator
VSRRGLDPERVVAAAAGVADAEGLGAVTVARVAAELGIRAPSVYNHVDGLPGLLAGIAAAALRDLAARLREAAVGRGGPEALVAVARAYRAFAREHPGRYAAVQRAPTTGDPAHEAAAEAVVGVLTGILRAWELQGADAVHAVRGLRSSLHGFVDLERAGGFALDVDLDESFERLVRGFAVGLGPPARA